MIGKVKTIEYSYTVIEGQQIRIRLETNNTYIQRWNKSDFGTYVVSNRHPTHSETRVYWLSKLRVMRFVTCLLLHLCYWVNEAERVVTYTGLGLTL